MRREGVGRNDLCPCGRGKKFKKCCMLRGSGYRPAASAVLTRQAQSAPLQFAFNGPFSRSVPPRRYATGSDAVPPEEPANQPKPPPPDAVPLLPVEVGLHYTYSEPFGEAEVTFIFPAGKTFLLENVEPILIEDLKAGDRVRLKEGQIATITAVELYYDPPEPAVHHEDGRVLSRVIGSIKHKGPVVLDVSWPGYTATSSPEHPYYSVSRQGYVPAQELQVGEFLRTDDNLLAPVLRVSRPRYGLVDLYNLEVEHYHN